MKFHSISALLIIFIAIIHDSVGLIVAKGNRVEAKTYPWVVKIIGFISAEFDADAGGWMVDMGHCTGSIIDELHILTAAHCFDKVTEANVTVKVGEICLSGSCKTGHKVKKIHKHPSYGRETMTIRRPDNSEEQFTISDIAILTLETALVFGDYIQSIPLPKKAIDYSPEHSLCTMAGWGSEAPSPTNPVNLQWFSLKMDQFSERTECQASYKLICGRHPQQTAYATEGDSGAGLMCEGVIAGVMFASPDRGDLPTSFQSVFHFLPFIHSVIREDEESLTAVRSQPKRTRCRPCTCL